MKGHRALAPAALALALGFLVARGRACATDPAQQTVRVVEVVPRELELGERVAILGSGFPSGKPARVTFRGTLHRPGERPVRDVEVVVAGVAVGIDRLEVAFDDAFQSLLCGAGDRAAHTTFEGDVEVAFGPPAAGAAPMAGVLEHVIVDARPSPGAATGEREADGERALAWIGVRAVVAPSGLLVENVDPGSRAQAAGISAGDVVTSFDGVRVASPSDLVPPAGEHVATIGFRPSHDAIAPAAVPRVGQGASIETTRAIRMDGFRRAPPADLVVAALLVWMSLVFVGLFAAPSLPLVAAPLQRMLARAGGRATGSGGRLRPPARGSGRVAAMFAQMGRDGLPPSGPPAVVDVVVCALLGALPFGQYVVAARLDVSLMFVAAVTSLVAAAVVTDCRGWRGVWRGLWAALHVTWQHVPAAIAVASVVAATGSLRIQEIEGAQGGWPWDWLAFRSPAALVAFVLLLACLRIEPHVGSAVSARSGLAALVEDGPPDAHDRGRPWLEAACRAHRVLVAGLASALFLGGWLLPGISAAQQNAHVGLELAGAVCLLAKTRLLLVSAASIRRALPGWSTGPGTRATSLWVAPLAVAAFVGTAAWSRWSPGPACQLLMSVSLVAAAALASAAIAHRVLHGAQSAAEAHLSPFL